MIPIYIATIMRPSGETGVQTHFRTFSEWLKKNKRETLTVTPFSSRKLSLYPIFAMRRALGILSTEYSVWWYRYWHFIYLKQALKTNLQDGKPSVVYAQCPLSAQAALSVRRNHSQKVFLVIHFNISQADEWADRGEIRRDGSLFASITDFEKKIIPTVDGIVFVSSFIQNILFQNIPGLDNVRHSIIPNFVTAPVEKNEFEGEFIRSDLVCVGTLEPRKNQRYALEIIAAAKKMGRPITLTLIGDGPDRQDLEQLSAKLGISEQVQFLGFISNAAETLNQYRACLHVALLENLPMVLIEAMSHGIPIFAPLVGGIPEIYDEGVEGRFIPLDSAERAAESIVGWLDSPSALHCAGVAAKRRFSDSFEADKVAEKLFSFLTSAR